ncbi:CD320 antigen-like, partial [Diaphorina citri]|uniref:CD320 antigen-like n=1 Tax=Diaphorina citri TaxID=121845 RepID=A0A1S3DT49_DIACI
MKEDRGKAAFGDTSLQMCAEGLFQCSRNTSYDELVCIPSIARCNGIPDCPGSSDEFGCEENQCHGNFQ